MACSSSCPTQDHESWGACVRSKRLTTAPSDVREYHIRKNKGIDAYLKARKQGIQPATVFPKDVAIANALSDKFGEAHVDGQLPSALKEQ